MLERDELEREGVLYERELPELRRTLLLYMLFRVEVLEPRL